MPDFYVRNAALVNLIVQMTWLAVGWYEPNDSQTVGHVRIVRPLPFGITLDVILMTGPGQSTFVC